MIVSRFTYTLESIIQAGKQLVAIDHVPIRTNPQTRESRLFPSMWSYVRRNAVSIFRIYAQYEPLRVFLTVAAVLLLGAVGVWIRFVVAYAQGNGSGHVQSLILGAVLFNAAVVVARARRDRRPAERAAHDDPAHPRARAADRAAAGDPAVALRVAGRGAPGGGGEEAPGSANGQHGELRPREETGP